MRLSGDPCCDPPPAGAGGPTGRALHTSGWVAELNSYDSILFLEQLMTFHFCIFAVRSFWYQGNKALTPWSADPALLFLII